MKYITVYVVVLSLLLFTSCTIDDLTQPQTPAWDVQFDIPVAKRSITFLDLFEDSLLTTNPYNGDSDSIFALRKSLEIPSLFIGHDVAVGQIEGSYNTQLGSINFEYTDPIKLTIPFRDLFPELSDSLNHLFAEQSTVALNSLPEHSFSLTVDQIAFSDFKFADVVQGDLSISLSHQLFSSLGDVNINLKNNKGNEVAQFHFAEPITPNEINNQQVVIKNVRFTDNMALSIDGVLSAIEETGMLTEKILYDTVEIHIAPANISASRSVARTPEQIIEDADTLYLGSSSRYVRYLKFSGGYLSVRINNYLPLGTTTSVSLPSLVNEADVPFTMDVFSTENSSVLRSYSLAGWKINLSELQSQVTYEYSIKTKDSGEQFVMLSSSDGIEVEVQVNALRPSELNGSIPSTSFNIEPRNYKLPELPDELSRVKLNDVDISASFHSNIQLPLVLDLRIAAYNTQGDSAITYIRSWSIDGQSKVTLPDAERLVNIIPNRVAISGVATVEGSGSILSQQTAKGTIDISVPVDFTMKKNAIFHMEPSKVVSQFPQQIDQFTIFSDIANHFEFGTEVFFLASESLPMYPENRANVDTLGSLIWPSYSNGTDSISISGENMLFFEDSFYLQPVFHFLPRTSTSGDTLPTRVFSSDSLHATIYSSIRYKNK